MNISRTVCTAGAAEHIRATCSDHVTVPLWGLTFGTGQGKLVLTGGPAGCTAVPRSSRVPDHLVADPHRRSPNMQPRSRRAQGRGDWVGTLFE
eukprot:9476619-Pyramimonas_sp.AAC.1